MIAYRIKSTNYFARVGEFRMHQDVLVKRGATEYFARTMILLQCSARCIIDYGDGTFGQETIKYSHMRLATAEDLRI